MVADWLDLPFCYVRPEPKKHGMGNQIEGKIKAGQKVVLIEDLVSTGGSSLGTGSSFTTPSISTTTTYYVECTIRVCLKI